MGRRFNIVYLLGIMDEKVICVPSEEQMMRNHVGTA